MQQQQQKAAQERQGWRVRVSSWSSVVAVAVLQQADLAAQCATAGCGQHCKVVRNCFEYHAAIGHTTVVPCPAMSCADWHYRWLLEEASTSTRTNAWYSLDIIIAQQQQQQPQLQQLQEHQQHAEEEQQQQPQECVLIVTSPFHQLRSYYTFKRAVQQKGLSLQVSIRHGNSTVLRVVQPLLQFNLACISPIW